jgi:pyridoxamine 5'-phosphate oxidase-like protein
VSQRMPKAAARLLDEGVLCYVAVRTAHGPHLTPLVYTFHAGRLWVTTARGSVKARAWRKAPEVAGMVRDGDTAVTFRGRVATYDALDPLSWPGAVVSAPRLARAAAKFSLKNARFFAGYAVDANRVPLSWTPPGRVFAAIRLTAGWVIDGKDGRTLGRWGEWPAGADYRKEFRPPPPAKGLGRRIPKLIREAIGTSGHGALALEGIESELTVLPAEWHRTGATYEAILPAPIMELAHARRDSAAALTVDRASSWRAAEMTGLLLQGEAQLFSTEATTRGRKSLLDRISDGTEPMALARIRPHRLVWWQGWTSGTVTPMGGAAS